MHDSIAPGTSSPASVGASGIIAEMLIVVWRIAHLTPKASDERVLKGELLATLSHLTGGDLRGGACRRKGRCVWTLDVWLPPDRN
jgi:hypothetical protein